MRDRLEYVARVSGTLLPRAFSFGSWGVLFTGDGPYEAHRLARLLPDAARARVDGEYPGQVSFGLVVVGRTGFYGDRMKQAVTSGSAFPRFVPQEGFVDELLFGRDWWTERVDLLNAAVGHHPGLTYAKSLENLPAFRRLADPEKRFRWPSTEVREEKRTDEEERGDYRETTPLFDLGYRTTGMDDVKRWFVLTGKALPMLALSEVAETIARLCRDRKRQEGGRQRYAEAIHKWEYDLARLKREFYDGPYGGFRWPSTDR